MSPWQQILFFAASTGLGMFGTLAANILYYRYKKREEIPSELHREVAGLQKDLVKVREDIARIKGRINGHGWAREA
jgi:hypothetical protein